MIDLLTAMESVVDAATSRTRSAPPSEGAAAPPPVEVALGLALPAARPVGAAASFLRELRRDPLAAAARWGCTFGAVLVWRAFDREQRAGAGPEPAAQAAIEAGLAFLELVPQSQFSDLGIDEGRRRAALLLLELQAIAALRDAHGANRTAVSPS